MEALAEILENGCLPESIASNKSLVMSHFEWILNLLFSLPNEEASQDTQLSALSCLHILASSLEDSPDLFRPLAKECMRYCLLVVDQGDCPVRSTAYGLMGILAVPLGDEMTGVFPSIMEHIQKDILYPSCKYSEIDAVSMLKVFADDTESVFRNHLDEAFQLACVSTQNPDECVRVWAVRALRSVVLALTKLNPDRGQRAYKTLVPTFACLMRRDSRMDVAGELCSALGLIFSNGLPPQSLSDPAVATPIFECIRDLMAKRMACQQDESQPVEDFAIWGCTIFGSYGRALDPDLFALYFKELHGSFFQFVNETSTENRVEFYGMIDDCIDYLGCRAVQYYDFLFPLLLGGFVEPEPGSRQNAYYGIGLLVSQVGLQAVDNYPEILERLLEASVREESGSVRDNVSGALARMIVANLQAVPLGEVLPPFMFMLPMTDDFSEKEKVLEAFQLLYNDAPASLTEYIEPMLLTSICILHDKEVMAPQARIAGEAFVKEIKRTYPDKFDKVSGENPEVAVCMGLMNDDQLNN